MKNNEPKISEDRLVGTVKMKFEELIRNLSRFIEVNIEKNKDKRGILRLYAEQSSSNKDVLHFNLKFENLYRVKFSSFLGNLFGIGAFNPILNIYKQQEDNDKYVLVYTSNIISNNKLSFSIKGQQLCSGDYMRKLKVEIVHRRTSGELEHQYENITTVDKIKQNNNNLELILNKCKIQFKLNIETKFNYID